MPLPHISASLPSGLNIRIRKSATLDGSTRINPSAPTPNLRSLILRLNSESWYCSMLPARAFTTTKSLPMPCIFVNFTRILLVLPIRSASVVGHGSHTATIRDAPTTNEELSGLRDINRRSRLARLTFAALTALSGLFAMRVLIEVRDGAGGDDRCHCVLIDQLCRFAHRIEQDGKGIEAANHPAQLDAADQVDGYADIFFANLIEKDVLQV